jgi:hypothetical protein
MTNKSTGKNEGFVKEHKIEYIIEKETQEMIRNSLPDNTLRYELTKMLRRHSFCAREGVW